MEKPKCLHSVTQCFLNNLKTNKLGTLDLNICYGHVSPYFFTISCFRRDIFNTHGFVCTHMNTRIFFLMIMITLLGHMDLEGVKDSK